MKKNDFIWEPYGDYLHKSNIALFMKRYGIKTYQELIKRSTDNIEWFWNACVNDLKIEWFKKYRTLYDNTWGMPWTHWFLDGKINIVHNCLDRHIRDGKGEEIAFYWEGNDENSIAFTYQKLYEKVCCASQALVKNGIGKNDVVGIYMSFIPETVIIMFAAMKIGAIALPIMSGFGAEAMAERLRIAKAKILFTSDGFPLRNKIIQLKNNINEILKTIPSLKKTIVIKRLKIETIMEKDRDIFWDDFLKMANGAKNIETQSLNAEHPALILFTSGTTGKPKGAIHTHAGALTQTTKEIKYYFDYKKNDIFFWYTDIGWMMGPWEILGVQFFGGTYVIFEGKPDWPDHNRLFRIIEKYKVSIFGIAPTAIRILKSFDDDFLKKYDISSLRILGSTGETWDKESYLWYFKNIGNKKCPIINISGGTEIIGCFLSPLPIMPLKPCTLGGPGLGMDIDVFNDNGTPTRGKIGHLVCKKPFPSMTKGFIGDNGKKKYIETYFSRWPDTWYHGDFAKTDKDGFWFLYGRSDDVIKVAGRRVGPAEIEDCLMSHQSVKEAAVIGIPDKLKGEKIVCFVCFSVLWSKLIQKETAEELLKKYVSEKLGKTLCPDIIYFVSALPKTRSGKIPRKLIKKVYMGEKIDDISSIENPQVLKEIREVIRR
ncbi:MAG: AMP-binding protein [Patescibacteria group bacterium]